MIRFLTKAKLKDKRVLLRLDLNVPLDKKGNITDDTRIKKSIPTIKYILSKKPTQLIIMSHLGRPKAKIIPKLKLINVARRLQKLLKQNIIKTRDCINIKIPNSKIVLLENLRFHKQEKENNRAFAKKLTDYADIYINDAFGTAHRKHASNNAITKFLPSYAGFLIKQELEKLNLKKPKKPFIAILGCAKISDKIDLIKALLNKVDKLLIGGLISFTFLKAEGYEVGLTRVETSKIRTAKALLKKYKKKIILPLDVKVALNPNAKPQTTHIDKIQKNKIGYDIGPDSVKLFLEELKKSKTVFWNGPLGFYENKKYKNSTNQIAKLLSKNTKKIKTIIGGGDTANAVRLLEKEFYHVSTGGGASLEFISGKELPAIKALEINAKKFKFKIITD
ncbi:phosphoglycerate kinase [Candidatus Woesearchaeota archaeon]|nr:phosphoglycerate kinase [Candidatus Woesearchaeota archaeon]MBL7050767.1 phosphoglycerate kinase [Candidatus Woesearchaeota archaeon]